MLKDKVLSLLLASAVGGLLFVAPGDAFGQRRRATTLSRVCPAGVRSVPPGFLWKDSSDVPGPRGGKPVVLLTGRTKTRTQSLLIFSAAGKVLCTFNFKAGQPGINGGADHYYSGWGSGCGKTGSQLARAAGGSVYVGATGGTCIGPINPARRTGGI